MLWSAYYYVHGTSCFCTLSASAFMHWTIPTWARFLFRNLFMETLHVNVCSWLHSSQHTATGIVIVAVTAYRAIKLGELECSSANILCEILLISCLLDALLNALTASSSACRHQYLFSNESKLPSCFHGPSLNISCVTVYSTARMCCLHNDNTHTWVCPLTAAHHKEELLSHWVRSELAEWDRRERLGPGERCGEERRSHWVCLDEYWSSTFEWEEEADHTQVQLSGAYGLDMRVQKIIRWIHMHTVYVDTPTPIPTHMHTHARTHTHAHACTHTHTHTHTIHTMKNYNQLLQSRSSHFRVQCRRIHYSNEIRYVLSLKWESEKTKLEDTVSWCVCVCCSTLNLVDRATTGPDGDEQDCRMLWSVTEDLVDKSSCLMDASFANSRLERQENALDLTLREDQSGEEV